MEHRLEELRMKLEKLREEARKRGMAVPHPRMPPLGRPVAIHMDSVPQRPSTSKASKAKEPAPEVVEMRRQFKIVEDQLVAVKLAKRAADEQRQKERKAKKELQEAKKKAAEKTKTVAQELRAKELRAASAQGGSSSSSSSSASDSIGQRMDLLHLVPVQHKTTPADLQAKDRIRFMSYKDRCQLTRDLSQLPEKNLGGMVRILRAREPKFKKLDNNKLEVDLDTLKLSTLWELKDYLASCLQKADKPEEAVASTSQDQKGASGSPSQSQKESESDWEWESTSSDDDDA